MNSVCAAGTGSFLYEQARKMGCSLSDYSGNTENVSAPLASDRCTVFMERDISQLFNNGYSVNEILQQHCIRLLKTILKRLPLKHQ
jgi:activator of 2-hydroxyglutaryl-CoA dehydratase